MSLLNAHLFGADPEFVILNDKAIIPYRARAPLTAPWGTDHGGYVIEPHPKPEKSVRKLIDNLKVSFNDFATVAPEGKWRAGAFVSGTTPRNQSLGGHIHIDKPKPELSQVQALDHLASYLEKLDILPSAECVMRRDAGGYGKAGDTRVEHGHWEYRSLPSWLYSQRVTKLCLVGAKLATLEPLVASTIFRSTTSISNLKKFYEAFKGKDDDADWFLEGGILDKKLSIDVTRDLREVWKVEPKKEATPWKKVETKEAELPQGGLRPIAVIVDNHLCAWYANAITQGEMRSIQERLTNTAPWNAGAVLRTPMGDPFTVIAERTNGGFVWSNAIRLMHHQLRLRNENILHFSIMTSQTGLSVIRHALYEWTGDFTRLRDSVCLFTVSGQSIAAGRRSIAVGIHQVEEPEEDERIDFEDDGNDDY